MHRFAAALVAFVTATSANSDVVTTDQVSDVLNKLVEEFSCKDVLSTIALNENPLAATTEEFLTMLVLRTFMHGYSAANKQTLEDAMQDTVERCATNLEDKFTDFSSK